MHGKFASFLRGIYFIRFPLSLWSILLLLGPLDHWTGAASFTRGILTPESWTQAATESFMVVSVGMIVLLLVRIIAVNGDERFETTCVDNQGNVAPIQLSWLRRNLGQPEIGVGLFLAAHFPGALLLGFVGKNIVYEIADPKVIRHYFAAVLLGIVLAYLFWLFVGLIYYWTFSSDTKNPVPREVIFPRPLIPLRHNWIKELQTSPPPLLSTFLHLPFLAIARVGKEGYARPEDRDHLYEGHRLAFIAFVGLAVLYVFFFSFTAPVPLTIPYLTNITRVIAVLVVAFTLAGCAFGAWPKESAARIVKILAIGLLTSLLAELIRLWITGITAPRGFSVLGSVLILITGIFWMLSTLAFAFDGTRLPILSFSAVFVLLLKGCAPYPGEHYFTVLTEDKPFPSAPTPKEVLDRRLANPAQDPSADYPPLIVITAEGGGIHSAAWTANVLATLENTFRDKQGIQFHSQILLASGVSGGSVGLLPFLREYTNGKSPFPPPVKDSAGGVTSDPVLDRLTRAADCSSLQAIAWGLSYYDILNFLLPIPIPNPSGTAVQGTLPTGLDRSWALERSFARNISDYGCNYKPGSLPDESKSPYDLTLKTTADLLREGNIPAFTFNTTAAETGGRYLLSNYELPVDPPSSLKLDTDILPAESFLHTFGHDETGEKPSDRKLFADLPLATAARLSATFSYVSSASRIPKEVSTRGLHFIDGGYYDNDGTASAMEFLYFALQGSKSLPEPTPPACDELQRKATTCEPDKSKVTSGRRLPILLIEIRNDRDIYRDQSPESFAAQNNPDYPAKWGPDHQLVAPLEGFYQAGHASDTFRNRRELCIFEKAFQNRLNIHHVIFDYRNPEDGHQPLSWDLTPNQQKSIACAIDPTKPDCSSYNELRKQEPPGHTIRDLAERAAEWFGDPAKTKFKDETCKATGLDTVPGS
jgi:hypothetical protein